MGANKRLVVSAINIFEGGPLSVLRDLIDSLKELEDFVIVLLVHKRSILETDLPKNFIILEFESSRKSYLYRLFYEYVYFFYLSEKIKASHWFSLHDTSPFVNCGHQFVYCHNPVVFRKINLKDMYISPSIFLQSLFYSLVYRLNLKSNTHIIVQQHWFKHSFAKLYSVHLSKILVALPTKKKPKVIQENQLKKQPKVVFFYPSIPRVFKNFETVCRAVIELNKQGYHNFEVRLTLDGTENNYAQSIYAEFDGITGIEFLGIISREDVFKNYQECSALIFASSLETWGLPLSEFTEFGKPILCADELYAKETIGDYQMVNFFETKDEIQLASYMIDIITDKAKFEGNLYPYPAEKSIKGWDELLEKILSLK